MSVSAAETVARELCAIQALHLGRDESGVDCAGAVRLLHQRCADRGVPGAVRFDLPAAYPLRWFEHDPRKMLSAIERMGWSRVLGNLRTMDVLIFALWTEGGDHPGVYLGAGLFFHAYQLRTQISSLEDAAAGAAWRKRIRGAFRPAADSPGGDGCPQQSPSSQASRSGPAAPFLALPSALESPRPPSALPSPAP